MAVQSVTVLADGHTIRVRGSWGASTWADFSGATGRNSGAPFSTATYANRDLATALVKVTAAGPGFDRVGNAAVANPARSRSFPAHQVRPRPFPQWPALPQYVSADGNNGHPEYFPTSRILPETDLGGGVREIDILTWAPIQPGDSVSVQFEAGWRTGLPAETVAAVNNSAVPIEIPAFRWIDPPFQVVRGVTSFQVDCLAAHVMPEGKSAVAGVRIVATDGVNKTTSWLSIGTSTKHGDNLRCWTGNVDLAGLTAGGVVLVASVFPWRGPARHCHALGTDPATETAANLHTGANYTARGCDVFADRPLPIAYDPTGARYSYTTTGSVTHLYTCIRVNPASGSSTSPGTRAAAEALCGFGATREAARAAAQALGGVTTQELALETLARLGRALPAANGVPTAANDIVDMEVAFDDGAHTLATGTLSPAPSSEEGWARFRGSSRANVTVFNAATGANRVAPKTNWIGVHNKFRPTSLANSRHWHHLCDLGIADGQTANSAYWSGSNTNETAAWLTNCRQTGSGTAPLGNGALVGTNCRVLLLRSVEFLAAVTGQAIVNCVKSGANTTQAKVYDHHFVGVGWDGRIITDFFVWGCAAYDVNMNEQGYGLNIIDASFFGDGRNRSIRGVFVNNLFEATRDSGNQMMNLVEGGQPCDIIGWIIEHNTWVGARGPSAHNDPTILTLLEGETFFHRHLQIRIANNYLDWTSAKSDTFNKGELATLRDGISGPEPKGVRPQILDAHIQTKYGCLREGNVVGDRMNPSGDRFRPENYGLTTIFNPNPALDNLVPLTSAEGRDWPGFVNDRSRFAAVNTGGGDYRLLSSSPLIARVSNAQIDADRAGELRAGTRWAAGSRHAEAADAAVVDLAVAGAVQSHEAGAATVAASASLAPAPALKMHRADVADVGITSGATVALSVLGGVHAFASLPEVALWASGDGAQTLRVVRVRAQRRTVNAGGD